MKSKPILLLASAALSGALSANLQAQTLFYGLGTGNSLVSFIAPETPTSLIATSAPVAITNLQSGQEVVGIDFRPFDGLLYAVARDAENRGFIYTVDPLTGVASNITVGGGAFTITGNVAVDFNPAALSGANALRVETSTDLNNRLTGFSTTGVTTALTNNNDSALNFGATPGDPNIVATAYSNNATGTPGGNGAAGTTQFAIDSVTNALYIQMNPNGGILGNGTTAGTPVGQLGVNPADGAAAGLDIVTGTNRALATLSTDGTQYGLYEINLATGSATLLGNFAGAGGTVVRDLSAPIPEPASAALLALGVGLIGGLRRRSSSR